jgi:SAM-dependent methyltransferase
MKEFPKTLWLILIVLLLMSLPIAGYSQKRLPDIHFEATPDPVVEAMLKMAGVNQEDIVYDLGCGDGRFVITAAKNFGARGVGVDIDPVRIKESNENAKRAGVTDRVKFLEGDLFKTDIREATVVTLYLLNELNVQLRPRLLQELKPGSRIVSNTFDMGEWEPDDIGQVRNKTFYYWIIPAKVVGKWRWSITSPAGTWENELFLDQEFQEVNGKVSLQGWELRIRETKLKGDQLSFRVRYNVEGENVAMRFKGRVNDGIIKGDVEIHGGPWAGKHEWVAKRSKK